MMTMLLHFCLAAFLILFCLNVQQCEASRILYDEEDISKELGLQSLQKGSVPGGASGCTHIPGTGGPPCPTAINSMNFAGNFHARAAAYPPLMVDFGVATATTTTSQK
ncbi:uncharacterized protein LOC126670100 [Mercurialis annua]|uniref:uncharacterized protein LOC126670100 n=1 Tax=Mercurialis annua TaxID=3986 RepID=UPI00215F7E01|nr:uncharacterized protein LOC126670100 [Mercurialis annua]